MIGVSDNFHKAAFGQIIMPIVALYVSFDKQLKEGGFFTLNQSQLNGPDLLRFAASDADTQSWDFYDYKDFSDRLVSVNWERSLQFPYQIQCGMVDFTLSNTDGYFTPLNPKSSIGANNLPARPMRLAAGFRYGNSSELIPQFSGITDGLPTVNQYSKTADYHAVDFLYDICNQELTAAISMRDAKTGDVIAAILQSYGLSPTQYKLAKGRFTVPFVFFDVGASIGDALKKLVQSENGFMWLDESGVVRFETTAATAGATEIVATLSDYDIMEITPGELSDIVNRVKITAEIRKVQEWQEVYTKSESSQTVSDNLWTIAPNGTLTMSCGLSDPCYDIVAPTINRATSVSWFTAQDEHFNPVTSGVTATGVLSSNAYTVTFTNTHNYVVEITEMKLWGEPAKVIDVINYDAYDDESVAKFGNQTLEVSDNQFFQTYYQANAFARAIIGEHKDYSRTIKVKIKGDFSFQLLDLIRLETADEVYNGIYRILSLSYSWDGKQLTTDVTLNGTNIEEGKFTLNISRLNGEDVLG